jgi:hypothetical protein
MTSENGWEFNRSDYSKRTIDTFELMSVYFIDIYYNHLYVEAKNLRNDAKASSITEGYKHALNAFILGIENNKHYKKTLVGIHDSFVMHGGFIHLSFAECISKITDEFIPMDYLSVVTKQQKITILNMVICQVNRTFVERIVRKFMRMIIDNHSEQDNPRLLQDEFVDLLILQRENIYHKFIDKQAKKTDPTLSSKVVESMQAEIKKLYGEKYELKKNITKMKKIIITKEAILSEKDDIIAKLKAEIVQLKDEVGSTQTIISPTEIISIPSVEIPISSIERSIPSTKRYMNSIYENKDKNENNENKYKNEDSDNKDSDNKIKVEDKDSDSDSDISEILLEEANPEKENLEKENPEKENGSKKQPLLSSQDLLINSITYDNNENIDNDTESRLLSYLYD